MLSLRQIHEEFKTQDQCMAELVRLRWPAGVHCPRCDSEKVWKLASRKWNWLCKQCSKSGYRFSPLVGTVFENTNYPLPIWFEVIYLICQSKKGMSALQVQRMLAENGMKTAYKTAFYMCHRVRAMLTTDDFPKLMGIVEVDETFIGGKNANRHRNKRVKGTGPTTGKVGVIGVISRKGNVVCEIIENTDTATLDRFVRKAVSDRVSLVATDEHSGYRYLKAAGYRHKVVSHGTGEYVRGEVHTQNLESFWALLKRGVVGTYHNVSKKYLPLYLNEFTWRHNNRKNPDIFRAALAGC